MRRYRAPGVVPAILSAGLSLGGCGGETALLPESAGRTEEGDEGSAAVAPARYLSGLAFTGTGGGSSQLYLELVNETSSPFLVRDYRGWIGEGADPWRGFLELRDTLPVPRAAWRVLPGGGLRVRIGDGARIVSLAYADSAHRIRLDMDRVLAEWTGPTGQRELLALATLRRDSVSQPGLLHFRRAARTAAAPADSGSDRILLLGDARGNGILVAASGSDTLASALAWGWLEGVRSRWTDVALRGSDEGPGTARWTLTIPSAGIAAELEAVPADSTSRPGPQALRVSGTLDAAGAARPVRGIALRSRLP